jgi:hypothetical protein
VSDGNQLWTQLLGRLSFILPDANEATYALSAVVAQRNGAFLSWGASWSGGLPPAAALQAAISEPLSMGRPAVCLGSADLTNAIRKAFDGLFVKGFVFAAIAPDGTALVAGDGKHCSGDEWKRVMGAIDMIKGDLSQWIASERKQLAEKDIHDIYDLAEKVFLLERETTPVAQRDVVARCSQRLYKETPRGLGIDSLDNSGETDPAAPLRGIKVNGIVEGTNIEASRSMTFPFSSAHFRTVCDTLSAELDDAEVEHEAQAGHAPVGMRP